MKKRIILLFGNFDKFVSHWMEVNPEMMDVNREMTEDSGKYSSVIKRVATDLTSK